MSDTAAPPEGLAAVLQHSLLPKLSPAGLQACAHTCRELRQAVVNAPWGVWRSAWNQACMPPSYFARSPHPYSSMGRLVKQHAAIRAGRAWSRTIRIQAADNREASPSFTALQPDFAQLASLCGGNLILTPMDRRDDAGYARCSVDSASTVSHFQNMHIAEQHSSGDHMYLVASNPPGLSLYACRPTLRPVNMIRLTGYRKLVSWAPNCQQFSILTLDKAYVVSVSGYANRAAEMHTVSEVCLVSCMWSPCSSYLAVSTWSEPGGGSSRLIVCARQGTVLSRLPFTSVESASYGPLAWACFDDRLHMAYSRRRVGYGPLPGEQIWLLDVAGSEPWGGFYTNKSYTQIGYGLAGGHRVADTSATDACVVLYTLTRAGLGCLIQVACEVDAAYSMQVLAAWAPQDSIWLAVLQLKGELMNTFQVIEGTKVVDCIHTACLRVLDGRSGQVVFEKVVIETSFEIAAPSLIWSGSSLCLLIGMQLHPDMEYASADCKIFWVKTYHRFG